MVRIVVFFFLFTYSFSSLAAAQGASDYVYESFDTQMLHELAEEYTKPEVIKNLLAEHKEIIAEYTNPELLRSLMDADYESFKEWSAFFNEQALSTSLFNGTELDITHIHNGDLWLLATISMALGNEAFLKNYFVHALKKAAATSLIEAAQKDAAQHASDSINNRLAFTKKILTPKLVSVFTLSTTLQLVCMAIKHKTHLSKWHSKQLNSAKGLTKTAFIKFLLSVADSIVDPHTSIDKILKILSRIRIIPKWVTSKNFLQRRTIATILLANTSLFINPFYKKYLELEAKISTENKKLFNELDKNEEYKDKKEEIYLAMYDQIFESTLVPSFNDWINMRNSRNNMIVFSILGIVLLPHIIESSMYAWDILRSLQS